MPFLKWFNSSTLSAPRVFVRRANVVDEGCPLFSQFEAKAGECLWKALNGTLASTYVFNNKDAYKLVGFSQVASTTSVITTSSGSIAARPITASMADQIMAGSALKILVGPNVSALEMLFPNDCTTISAHSVSTVLNNLIQVLRC